MTSGYPSRSNRGTMMRRRGLECCNIGPFKTFLFRLPPRLHRPSLCQGQGKKKVSGLLRLVLVPCICF